jgi:hypothetical protein
MLKVRDLISWLAKRADEEVYICGDELCCDDTDTIHVGDADEYDEQEN